MYQTQMHLYILQGGKMAKYKIYRYYQNGNRKLIKIVSSLKIAKLHCNDPLTRKQGKWFDGYVEA